MQRAVLAWLLFVGACSGDAPPGADATPAAGAFGAACVTVSNTSTECTSQVCTDSIDLVMHPVCSQQCTFGMNDSCPAGSTGAKTCNRKGFCKP
jgi:hypothetical protein